MYSLTRQIVLIGLALSFFARAGIGSPESQSLRQTELRDSLTQMGEYRFVYRMFFKLYDVALFSDSSADIDADSLLDGSNRVYLEFDYLRKIDKSTILKSSKSIIPKNMSDAEFASINDRVRMINEAYRTVGKGDRSALSFIPGQGTTLWINEEAVLTVPGEDFARLYFRIWLGPAPISEKMRDALLEGESA